MIEDKKDTSGKIVVHNFKCKMYGKEKEGWLGFYSFLNTYVHTTIPLKGQWTKNSGKYKDIEDCEKCGGFKETLFNSIISGIIRYGNDNGYYEETSDNLTWSIIGKEFFEILEAAKKQIKLQKYLDK